MSDVDHKNMLAVLNYAKETRELLRAQQERIDQLEGLILTANGIVINLQQQVGMLLVRLNSGGSTSGN